MVHNGSVNYYKIKCRIILINKEKKSCYATNLANEDVEVLNFRYRYSESLIQPE